MSSRPGPTSPDVLDFVERRWEEDILPTLTRYIEIPAKSPAFDPEWSAHGHIDRAVALIEVWSRRRPIEGLTVETVRLPGRTPVILLEVPGTSAETVPKTSLKLSLRIPPTLDAAEAARRLREILETDPPYGARVTFQAQTPSPGWDAPATGPWLLSALHAASERYFGKPAMFRGAGGAIPFMAMLGARFPRAQFFITGTGGPGCNAHGPNEFLHLPMAKRLTACVADVIVAHHRARRG